MPLYLYSLINIITYNKVLYFFIYIQLEEVLIK